jgi:hypothetical protein
MAKKKYALFGSGKFIPLSSRGKFKVNIEEHKDYGKVKYKVYDTGFKELVKIYKPKKKK